MKHWIMATCGILLTGCTVQVFNPEVNTSVAAKVEAAVVVQQPDTAPTPAPSFEPIILPAIEMSPGPTIETPNPSPSPSLSLAPQVSAAPSLQPVAEVTATPAPVPSTAPQFEKAIFDNSRIQFKHYAGLRKYSKYPSPNQVALSTSSSYARASLYVTWTDSDETLEAIMQARLALFRNASRDILSESIISIAGVPAGKIVLDGHAEIFVRREGLLYSISFSYPIDASDTPVFLAGVDLLVSSWKWLEAPASAQ